MTVQTVHCLRADGRPKERFESEQAARRAVARKRKYRNRRYPKVYHCPAPCHGYHLTAGSQL